MKTRSIIALIAVVALAVVVSCVKDLEEMGVSEFTEYIGTVVEKSTMQPIEGVKVQVTDGIHIHASTETDKQGKFVLKNINFNEVDTCYYLLLDGSSLRLPSTKEKLRGMGYKTYDYNIIVLYDITTDCVPKVTTITPTVTGMTVTAGGNVTSDGGYPVTARGICYGTMPHPDLSSSHNHTVDGSGTGTYGSTFNMTNSNTLYYIRAYATNSNGTSYGEQKTAGGPYFYLPTFTYGGRTYRVAPTAGIAYTWDGANKYCSDLALYGYSDWRLPTLDELRQMYVNRISIGGFGTGYYWSGTTCGSQSHNIVNFSYGNVECFTSSSTQAVRPIRVEN